jgi:hypothetical protein
VALVPSTKIETRVAAFLPPTKMGTRHEKRVVTLGIPRAALQVAHQSGRLQVKWLDD